MKTRQIAHRSAMGTLLALTLLLPLAVSAQVPVDEDGSEFTVYSTDPNEGVTGNEGIPLLSTVDLEELVGPVALYPDDLLAIILPASAYPLQIMDAARFLEALDKDPTLEPDPEWDDAVVALLNYPEVIEFLNDDIDWTWRLGEAVVAQQADVVAAVEAFRDRAYAAGNLKSDDHQRVTRNNGVIEIAPASDDVIYVPYYEPDRVVVYQPRPVYYYYPRAYPVYYYPYSSAYRFDNDWFWGVTTTFRIGWFSDSLHVLHHSYYGHPYFGRQYYDRWWYRRPSIRTHNVIYVGGNSTTTVNRYYGGDRWRPRHDRREYLDDHRFSRHRHERFTPTRQLDDERSRSGIRRVEGTNIVRHGGGSAQRHERLDGSDAGSVRRQTRADRDPIAFRQRPESRTTLRGSRPVEDVGRSRKEGAVRGDNESRWRPSRRSERPTQMDSHRQQREYRSVERSTTRRKDTFATAKRQVTERARTEPAPKVARTAPSARSERRTESFKRPQVRREEPRARSTPRPASPPARAEHRTYQTQKSHADKASRKAGRLAAKNDYRR